jgi:hypothetical protein
MGELLTSSYRKIWPCYEKDTRDRGELHSGFWWGNLRERDHLEDPGINGRIILRRIFMQWDGGMDRIDLVEDRDRWRDVLNGVMNLQVPWNQGSYWAQNTR